MRRHVAWQNIERYRRLIAKERDECRRDILQKLLAMEAVRWGRLVDKENAPDAPRALRIVFSHCSSSFHN